MTATAAPTDEITVWVDQQRSFGSRPPHTITQHTDGVEAWKQAQQLAVSTSFVSVIELTDGRLFVVDTIGGRNLARWASANNIGWREIGNIGGNTTRIVDSSTLVTADGRQMLWTSATAAGAGLPAPAHSVSVANNTVIGGPIRFNFNTRI